MSTRKAAIYHHTFTVLLGMMALLLVLCIVFYPSEAFKASMEGLQLWWTIIFPSLLPFLIFTEIIMAYGVFHLLGVLLEPIMRLLFRMPGIGGPVMAISCTVGFPTGARLTSKLRQDQLVNRKEGEILLAVSHIGSPVL